MNKNDFLATAKLTSKGQITIPKIVREALEISDGDSVIFYLDKNKKIKVSNRKDCKIETNSINGQVSLNKGEKNE